LFFLTELRFVFQMYHLIPVLSAAQNVGNIVVRGVTPDC